MTKNTMDHTDKLLPLLVLGVLCAILLVLLRRGSRERPAVSVINSTMNAMAGEEVRREAGPAPAVAVLAIAAAAAVVEQKPRRAKPLPAPVSPPSPSTIDTVLGLLHDRQSLAAAFLLREIFAPPVSRRARLPRDR